MLFRKSLNVLISPPKSSYVRCEIVKVFYILPLIDDDFYSCGRIWPLLSVVEFKTSFIFCPLKIVTS